MRKEKWNDNWLFWEDKDSFALLWDIPEKAVPISLPHDAMIQKPATPDSKNKGCTGYHDGGNYCYAKRFFVPSEALYKTILFKFEGVYMNAMVYINNQLAAQCPNGYSTFYVKADDYLIYGQENEIRVSAKTEAMTNSRWYSGSGIYRDVYYLEASKLHLAPDETRITCKTADPSYASLEIDLQVENDTAHPKNVCVKSVIRDKNGVEKFHTHSILHLSAGEKRHAIQQALITNPDLWDDENPVLYCCSTELYEDSALIDSETTSFGIRSLALDPVHGLQVNGKTIKLRGACLHHDSGFLGAATYEDVQYRQIRRLKQAGFNAIRMAHNPMAPAMLRACDELGLYVMDEFSDMWTRSTNDFDYALYFHDWWEKDLTSMVKKDYNHPCVIMYSIGNEIPEIGTAYGEKLCSRLAKKTKELDQTRFTTLAVNGFFGVENKLHQIVADVEAALPAFERDNDTVNDFLAKVDKHVDKIVLHPIISDCLDNLDPYLDIVGYNYMANRYPKDLEERPMRLIVGSETYPPTIARNWRLTESLPNVIGDFTWTGWDYIGEAGIGIPGYAPGTGGMGAEYPCQISYCGDIDLTGFRRPMSYLREIIFHRRTAPYIAVQNPSHFGEEMLPSPWILSDSSANWNWSGYEEKPVIIEVFSAGDSVELFRNGQSLGLKPAGINTGYRVLYQTTYAPGTLEAVSYENNVEIGRHMLCTTKKGVKYILSPEILIQDHLIYIDISYSDEDNRCVPDQDQMISVTCENAEILALGNGDPRNTIPYQTTQCMTFEGRALLILKQTGPDPVKVTLISENKITNELIIKEDDLWNEKIN